MLIVLRCDSGTLNGFCHTGTGDGESSCVKMSARFSSGRSLSVIQLSLGHFCRRSVIYKRWLGFIYIRGLKLNLAGPLKAQSA